MLSLSLSKSLDFYHYHHHHRISCTTSTARHKPTPIDAQLTKGLEEACIYREPAASTRSSVHLLGRSMLRLPIRRPVEFSVCSCKVMYVYFYTIVVINASDRFQPWRPFLHLSGDSALLRTKMASPDLSKLNET